MAAADKGLELGLVTNQADKLQAFYTQALDFRLAAEIPFPGIGTVFRLEHGVRVIKILAVTETVPDQPAPGQFTGGVGMRYYTLWVDDLEGALARCQQAGAAVPVPPRDLRPGVRVAMVTDPDGNTLELMMEC